MHADIAIIGSGASGLTLAYRISKSDLPKDLRIVIIDSEEKTRNDRTWCFWEKDPSIFESIVHSKWDNIIVKGENFSLNSNIEPFKYKCIRGIDFYNKTLATLKEDDRFEFIKDTVDECEEKDEAVLLKLSSGECITANRVFNSVPKLNQSFHNVKYPTLNQHFIGWVVETEDYKFNTNEATFMDFSIAQKGNTRFMYVLPYSENQALFEYTLFSEDLLKKEEYESEIKTYLKNLGINDYKIIEEEKGCIPMTAAPMEKGNSAKVTHIGTAGGWTKASTGYTFSNILKHTESIVGQLSANKNPDIKLNNRYRFYDDILIDVLIRDNSRGAELFTTLFKKRTPQSILSFLIDEGNILDNLRLMSAMPMWHFTKAFFRRLKK